MEYSPFIVFFFKFVASPVATVDFTYRRSGQGMEVMNYIHLLPSLKTHETTIRFPTRFHNAILN